MSVHSFVYEKGGKSLPALDLSSTLALISTRLPIYFNFFYFDSLPEIVLSSCVTNICGRSPSNHLSSQSDSYSGVRPRNSHFSEGQDSFRDLSAPKLLNWQISQYSVERWSSSINGKIINWMSTCVKLVSVTDHTSS